MGLKFIGERAPELLAWPESERRQIYFKALRKSYCRIKTWIGFVAFLLLASSSHSLAEQIYALLDKNIFSESTTVRALQALISICAWIILAMTQVEVIRKELRKLKSPNKRIQTIS